MKFKQCKKAGVLALSAFLLAACGSDDEAKNESVDDSKLLSLVKQTNYSTGFPPLFTDRVWGNELVQQGTVRFDTDTQIPLYYVSKDGSAPPPSIANAVTTIEARLGDVFSDVQLVTEDLGVYRNHGIANQNVGNGTYNEDSFKNSHSIIGGIVIAQGTGFYSHEYSNDPKSMCANASIAPYDGSMALLIDPLTQNYSNDELLWVNMGNGQCGWDTDIVIHEMAHAMGMYTHLDGYFGSWSNTAMDILATLYGNPTGTDYSALTPKR
ncbi:hypothetical protein [Enterovibrio norvegicus]|uniref:hypothetical protein n=1 Tax=Enterovibrio norvegicus TaxID=188144 RepID=UPI000C817414|nr:hypothetical protein [Enterovibrio norvegicus]PMN68318.1 hypothetical protein BCT27_24045 [Enterovibrio norvegicus]